MEYLHVEKIAPFNIHQLLLNIYRDQSRDMSTVRCFSSCNNDLHQKKITSVVQIFTRVAYSLLWGKCMPNRNVKDWKIILIPEIFLYPMVLSWSIKVLVVLLCDYPLYNQVI